jgi:serine/threonine-protein kinase ULK/ATG1
MLASQVKIIDFGLATRLGPEDLTYTALGSPINMDPLILKKYNKAGGYETLQGYNEKADIWSLGTICYEMLTGEAMFKVNNMKELMTKVEKGNYTIPINSNFSKEAVAFLNSMLQYDPNSRLSAEELAQQDFIVKNVREFTQVDLSMVSNKIDNKGLHVNVKQNQTIWNIFNNDEDQTEVNSNPIMINNNQKIKKDQNSLRRNSTEQEYVFSNNIYHFNNKINRNFDNNNNIYNYPQTERNYYNHDRRVTEFNDRNNKNYNYDRINVNYPFHYNNRFTEGFVSPGKNKSKFFEPENKEEEKRDMITIIKEKIEKEENEIKEKKKKKNEKKKKE